MGKLGDTEKDIPGWIQDHIAKSENYIQQASSNYHEYSTNEAGINGAPRFPSLDGVANESVNEEEIKWNAVENAIINFLKANTKILDKRVKDRDTEGVKGGLKSIISGLTNAQRNLKLESVNENFAKFDTLKMAVNQHEKGAPYYDKIRLINIFNQLSSSDQVKAKKQYRGYFGESVNEVKYSLTSAYLGNGLTYWNAEEEDEAGDYKRIAHIDKAGKLTIYDNSIPSDIKKFLAIQANAMKKGVRPSTF
jgi:hypothetical protein